MLGDMLELGAASAEGHRSVGRTAAAEGFAVVITYGDEARRIYEAAAAAGCLCRHAATHEEAANLLRGMLADGDTVLFKGSRGMRMEHIMELAAGEGAKH